jgi:hypothetical protein
MRIRAQQLLRIGILAAMLSAPPAWGLAIQFTIDTTGLSGTSAQLAFDLIDGGAPSNSVSVDSFSTDGILGNVATIGGVTGTLPGNIIITDTSFFNEYLQDITLGSQISFILNDTANAPGISSFPDGFSFFLLDPLNGLPLASTTDPTGADSLFLINIGTSNGLEIYSGQGFSVTTNILNAVPEPNSLVLAITALTLINASTLKSLKKGSSFSSEISSKGA